MKKSRHFTFQKVCDRIKSQILISEVPIPLTFILDAWRPQRLNVLAIGTFFLFILLIYLVAAKSFSSKIDTLVKLKKHTIKIVCDKIKG
ncbi:hypothetical protein BSK63_23365 [Paenibacillus odorifer]|uniref:Uncharacterized protein n=1 Tax=Paenibacillus odorifer TaxID=189426 RepID=A0A1R0X0Z5_9BACL|nr:hypothetical protein BJP51_27670 [Paenibacillus odorifer]OME28854.1 hypothetical protein BSK63_23365 [Paenibacillus odorifer]